MRAGVRTLQRSIEKLLMLRSKANRGNSFQRFRDAVTETLRLYKIQIDSALLTGLLSYIWRCMSDTQKAHYRRPDVRIQAPRDDRIHDRIAQDREWQPILQELGQRIIDLHACRCKADAPSLCFDGTCTVNADALRNWLPNIHRLWSNHKHPREECSSADRTDGGSPTTTSSSLNYAESLMPQHRTEATVVVTPNVPSQLDISEFYTLMQDPGNSIPPSTSYNPFNSYPLHEPATDTAAVVDDSSGLFSMTPMIDPAPQAQSTYSYAIYAVPISSLQGQGVTSTWDTRHNISGTRAHQSYAETNANATTTGINGETHRFYIVPESALAGRIAGQGRSNSSYQGANGYEATY
jgi:hypothetical protein